jgi:phage-related protein
MEGMTLEKLQVIIQAQIEQYTEAMKTVQNTTDKAVGQVEKRTKVLNNVFKKVGKAIAAAFSIAALVNFGRACIEVGSDLAEVQNVVDVTFGESNKKIEEFAKNAAESFGLSELSAKQYTSTMGAMLKSMGVTGTQLEDMSTELAGLAGDIASFYNLDTDEAFSKIRSGISGETEPLKQLGINLSVANLEQYALTQGIKKSYSAMTQQEQAVLRYNYLLSVTSDAQGDFARTSDSWANQVRILQLKFESLKATLGQAFINVLTPVLKVINQLISKLQTAADAFSKLISLITGKSSTTSTAVSSVASSVDTATDSTDDLTASTEAAGTAAKEAYSGLGSFDEINSLTKNSSSGSGSTSADDLADIDTAVETATDEADEELNPVLQKAIDKLKELSELFKDGFKSGLGDVTLEPLQKALESIKASLKDIFTDTEVVAAANRLTDTLAYTFGQVTGATASVGTTIATNIVGGISLYLEQNTDRIRQYIISMFDITGETATIIGNYSQAFANIFSAFGGENGQQLTANLIGIFTDASMGITELMAKAGRDILDVFTRPFIDNQEELKEALDGILETFATVTGSIKDTVDSYMDTVNTMYDDHIKPFFDSLASGLSDCASKFLEFWNSNVKPVLDQLASKFDTLMSEHVTPLLNRAVSLIGSVADAAKALWEGIVKPFIDWMIAYILPVILPIIETIVSTVIDMAGNMADYIGGIIEVIQGIIDFLVGIFTGDWETAWNGIEEIVEGVLETISSVIELVLNVIGGTIQTALNTISAIFSTIFHGIASLVKTIFNTIKTAISTAIATIKNGISTGLSTIKAIWTTTWTNLKTTVTNIFDGIWTAIKGTINSIIGGVEHMANAVVNGINTVIDALNNLHFDIPDWVPELGGKSFGFSIARLSTVSLPRLATGGIVDSATPLIAGEAGREAILPLENNTGWMDDLAAKLGEIISVNVMGAIEDSQEASNDFTVTTVVNMDGKAIVEQTDRYRKRQGYRLSPT